MKWSISFFSNKHFVTETLTANTYLINKLKFNITLLLQSYNFNLL